MVEGIDSAASTSRSRAKLAQALAIILCIFLISLMLNFSLDSSNCVVFGCLTKRSAFNEIQLAFSRDTAELLLRRAGVSCPVPIVHCSVYMFSDFWRQYLIQIDPDTNLVVRKNIAFRNHGKGLVGLLRHLR
jgi:hypothetical protein